MTTDAVTATDLMRSRYSAFVKRLAAYLAYSWDPSTVPPTVSFREGQTWTGLEIVSTDRGGPDDLSGTVEFSASYELDGRNAVLRERSSFVRHDGRWVYLEGEPGET